MLITDHQGEEGTMTTDEIFMAWKLCALRGPGGGGRRLAGDDTEQGQYLGLPIGLGDQGLGRRPLRAV